MKKTILAIAIPALFASAANAAVIYDKDGTNFDVYGRVQANYYGESDNPNGLTEAHKGDAELVGTSRLGWSGKVALNNTWSAIAKTEWQVSAENTDGSTFKARHIYAGFDGSQNGKVIFGQTDTAFYDAIASTDIFNEWGSNGNYYDGRQEGQVIYSNSFGGFTGKLSYQTNDETAVVIKDVGGKIKTESFKDVKRKAGYAASAGYAFDFGLGLNAGYAYSDLETNNNAATYNSGEKSEWALSANYAINGFYFAGMYTQGTLKNDTTGHKDEGRGYELAASYNVDAWTFLAGYNFKEGKKGAQLAGASYEDQVDETLLGVQYAFTPKLKAYTEYKIQGMSKMDDEYTVALQYNF
ncbi:porin [Aeromonas veronii]|uniref:porin n=1 Tax=Aeromonas veronii TaxID=654 RepID=UPI00132A7AFC|nr:porin [Aeromonas veronii]MBL0595208.1 porin [Aeromonas veronii]MCF5869882.1 porin [Aeromonas veronii]MXV29497.1 porin [Aeromonas veronii]